MWFWVASGGTTSCDDVMSKMMLLPLYEWPFSSGDGVVS